MNEFIYQTNDSQIKNSKEDKIVIVSSNISTKKELFSFFIAELKFPSFFGENWDAFYDCLSDLSWIKNDIVWIIHKDLPLKDAEYDLKKYIEILYDLINADASKRQMLKITFPEKYKNEIEGLLKN